VQFEYDRTLYKQRDRIERMFGHLKINSAIATHYGQLASGFLGTVHLATARYWLEFVHAAWQWNMWTQNRRRCCIRPGAPWRACAKASLPPDACAAG
jgi:hypothetical protein